MLKWLWLSVLVVVLDQGSKYLAERMLTLHDPVALMPLLNMTLSHNPGAAFSFLADAGGWQRWLFIALAALVSVVLVVWLRKLSRADAWIAAAVTLVLGGAIGNLIDRVTHQYVIDFIDVYYKGWHWYTFNVADMAITVGVVVLIADGLFGRSKDNRP